jgi:hypothetical protein
MEGFPTTLPQDAPDLDRVSAFADWLQAQPQHPAAHKRPPGLSASVWQDLWCASPLHGRSLLHEAVATDSDGPAGRWRDVVEVLAASLRHAQALTLYLGGDTHVVPLTLYPLQRLARCPLDDARFEALRLAALRVLHVEPALLRAPDLAAAAAAGNQRYCRPLAPIGWLLALQGPRREVLPELAGGLACRRVPGLSLQTPGLGGAVAVALERLGQESASLRTIASWPGMDPVRAARLVNGLYLQGALIVSRSHPAARER